MISASPLILAAAAVLWHPASSPEPACRCERPGEQWFHTLADPVRLAPGTQAAWVSDGSRLFVATSRPFELEGARWLVARPGERVYWAESSAPSPLLMARGARLLQPKVDADGLPSARAQARRVSYPGGRFADALAVAAGTRLEFDVPPDREVLLELIDQGAARGSNQVSVGWDLGAPSTRTVTWLDPGARSGARLQRILLLPPLGSRRLVLVALDDVVLRVLAQRWRSPARGPVPAVSYWHPSANDAIARARDSGIDPASRWQVPDERRSSRQSFFRSLLPSGGGAIVRMQWDGYTKLADSPTSALGADPDADAQVDLQTDGEFEADGGGGGGRHPWLKLGADAMEFELPARTADSLLRVLVRGPGGEFWIRFDDQAPLRMQLRERGPLEAPGTAPADGSARLLLPAGVRRLRAESRPGQSLEISLAYRTARSYRLSESAYGLLLASTDGAALFRDRLRRSPELRAGEFDAAPSAEQELLNHWAGLLRRLPEATMRTRLLPTQGGCVAAAPAAPGSLGRRLLAQQALFGCSPLQRQAGWNGLSAVSDRGDDDLSVAVAALAHDGAASHWRWLAEALQRHGWRDWSQDVARVAGLALPEPLPPTAPALLARTQAAGAIPAQARGSERIGWLWRASHAQPLTLSVPAGSRRVELAVRALPGAQEQWLPVRLDGADFAVLALPGLAWSWDLLDARTRRPLPAAVRIAIDLPTGAKEVEIKPNQAEVLVSATWQTEATGYSRGPVVIIDPANTGSGSAWASRYRFDQSGDAQALLAMVRAAASSDNADQYEPDALEAVDNQAARALAWARPGHWTRLTIPEGGAGFRDLPAASATPASERWWVATRQEPIAVYWPEPAVVRVTTARPGRREVDWLLVVPDRPLHLQPAAGENERLLQIHIWQPATARTPPAQPGPLTENWRRGWATGGAAPVPGDHPNPVFPAHRWTEAVTVALTQRPEAEDGAAAVAGSTSWQSAWQRFRHLPEQQAFVGVELVARTSAGRQAVGGSMFYDWQPTASIWSASVDAQAWLTDSQSVLGLRGTGRADWAYGARWDHQISVSGQLWQGPATALADGGVWSSYRASHRRALTLEDRWRWWVSPASHGLARLQWRSNEDLTRDQSSAWLGWQVASGRWSAATEVGVRWLAADADRRTAARKPALRLGFDYWLPVGSKNGLIANLGILLGETRAEQSLGLELMWFRHEGRGMDDFSPRRLRFLELRQSHFMEKRP